LAIRWKKSGTVLRNTITVGPWTELIATIDGVDYYLGTVKRGNLIVEQRRARHRSTTKKLDVTIPSAVAIEFRGIMEEIHRQNVLIALGRSPTEDPYEVES